MTHTHTAVIEPVLTVLSVRSGNDISGKLIAFNSVIVRMDLHNTNVAYRGELLDKHALYF